MPQPKSSTAKLSLKSKCSRTTQTLLISPLHSISAGLQSEMDNDAHLIPGRSVVGIGMERKDVALVGWTGHAPCAN